MTVRQALAAAVDAVFTTKGEVHLAAAEAGREGIEGACGARSAELPLEHSFTTDPAAVTCRGCRPPAVPAHVWTNAVAYRGGS